MIDSRDTASNIIINNDFSEGLQSWNPNCCDGFVVSAEMGHQAFSAKPGSKYAVVANRKKCWHALEQDITSKVSQGCTYSVSAYVGISGQVQGSFEVIATLKLKRHFSATSFLFVGKTSVSSGKWEKLEGTFSLSTKPDRVIFYLEGPSPGVDLLIRSVVITCPILVKNNVSDQNMNDSRHTASNIIINHDFSAGLQYWHPNCCAGFVVSAEMGHRAFSANPTSKYAVVTNRKKCWHGLEQNVTGKISQGYTYSVSAYVGVSGPVQGSSEVIATLNLERHFSATRFVFVGKTSVSSGRWEKLEGTFSLSTKPDRVIFYLEGPSPGVDLLIRSVVITCPNLVEHNVIVHPNPLTLTSDWEFYIQSDNTGCFIGDGEDNIVLNPKFEDGLNNWSGRGCEVALHHSMADPKIVPMSGKVFASATKRTQNWNGIQQEITGRVQSKLAYDVTAFVRIYGNNVSSANVRATLWIQAQDLREQYVGIANLQATDKDWVQLQGKFLLNGSPKRIVIYFEGPPAGTDILLVSLVVKQAEEIPPSPAPVIVSDNTGCLIGDGDGDDNIILNPKFEDGLTNWSGRGCEVALHDSMADGKIVPMSGKVFASATKRTQSWNGIQQEITGRVQRKLAYDVTAFVRTYGNNVSSADVRATLWIQTSDLRKQYIGIANLQATDKDWVQLQGKFLLNCSPIRIFIFLKGPPAGTDILLNSLVVKHAEKTPPSPAPIIVDAPYGVNIVQNSNLYDGTNGWFALENCTLSVGTGSPRILPPMARDSLGSHEPLSGRYILVTNCKQTSAGPAQMITDNIKLFLTYQVAAWVKVGYGATGPQNISVALFVDNQYVDGGQAEISDDRWHEIGGSFRIEKQPSKVILFVQGPAAGVDFMVAGLQIFPVCREARFQYLRIQTDKIRKRNVTLKFSAADSSCLMGTVLGVRQTQNSFPFGSCMSRTNIDNEDFVDFFVKNFNWAVFGNELKWHWTEPQEGYFNHKDADDMLDLCVRNNIEARGHCIFWDVDGTVQQWVKNLNKNDLATAVQNRLTGLLTRYKGKFKHYDVNNEMLHGSFYQDLLGKDVRANMFKTANQLDPSAVLFVNDYHIEDGCDTRSTPERYIEQILNLKEQGAPVGGIGIQGHIDSPVGPIVCSALDKLGILGLPIWFTELDVSSINEYIRGEDLEVMLGEAYAHPAVEGIMLWGFWEFMSRDNAHLVNAEGDINKAGKRYLALKQEWLSYAHGHIDEEGEFAFRGFHGTYDLEIVAGFKEKMTKTFVVEKGYSPVVITIDL